VKIYLDDSIDAYRTFLKIKALPRYEIHGRMAVVPDEYAATLGVQGESHEDSDYLPRRGLFDYQRDIVRMAVRKRKFAIFADCGLGKTLMLLEFARHVRAVQDKPVLIVSPLMVVKQTMEEAAKFYGDSLPIEQVSAKGLAKWMTTPGGRLGITNYDALRDDTPSGDLGGLILDESSMLKSHYGKWGQVCLRMGAGIPWTLALTGTPAPNARI
jgi:superfamily II DNA or RNA helicase